MNREIDWQVKVCQKHHMRRISLVIYQNDDFDGDTPHDYSG